jgi:hypothetical protein
MTVLQIIALIAQLVGAAKDVTGVLSDIHELGLKPGDPIPPEHEQKIRAVLSSVSDTEWDQNHIGN